MPELNGIERIHPSVAGPVREYARLIDDCFGGHAAALVVFGRALTPDFDAKADVVASVLVVDEIDLGALRTLAGQGPRLGGLRIAAPLVMTPSYIESSRDTFPLELIEIQQKHVALWGEDPFARLTFEAEHVRLQCEREFKRLLIQLRQGLLKAADQDFLLAELQHALADDLVRTLRGVLWLEGQREATPRGDVVAAAARMCGRELSGLKHALDRGYEPGWEDFQAFYADVAVLATHVDRKLEQVR